MVERPNVEHIIRRASLPWRPTNDRLTECGQPSTEYPSITYDDFVRKLRVQGQQRTAMSSCMTCWNTATRYRDWSVDPVDAIRREAHRMRHDEDTFRKELWAIAALIEAHRDDFDSYLAGLAETTDLTARRRAKRTRHIEH